MAAYEYVLLGIGFLFTSAVSLVYLNQKKLIYVPFYPEGSRERVAKPDEFFMPNYENVTITTPDHVKITGYLIKYGGNEESRRLPTIMFFHANAGNMGHRLPIAKVLYQNLHCNVFMLSYRGYGHSEGSPNEEGLCIDSQAALDFLLQHPDINSDALVAYGQSIGGAVAIDIVARNKDKFKGLIIENTFVSLRKLIPYVIKYFGPFAFLCTEHWESIKKIPVISCPILFLSGSQDELIPPQMMRELHDAASQASQKKIILFPNGTHNDTPMMSGYFEAIVDFWHKNIFPVRY